MAPRRRQPVAPPADNEGQQPVDAPHDPEARQPANVGAEPVRIDPGQPAHSVVHGPAMGGEEGEHREEELEHETAAANKGKGIIEENAYGAESDEENDDELEALLEQARARFGNLPQRELVLKALFLATKSKAHNGADDAGPSRPNDGRGLEPQVSPMPGMRANVAARGEGPVFGEREMERLPNKTQPHANKDRNAGASVSDAAARRLFNESTVTFAPPKRPQLTVDKISVEEQLSGRANLTTWMNRLRPQLKAAGLWIYVSGELPSPPPLTAASRQEEVACYNEYASLSLLAYTVICKHISAAILQQIQAFESFYGLRSTHVGVSHQDVPS
jgi:hypothetical protein